MNTIISAQQLIAEKQTVASLTEHLLAALERIEELERSATPNAPRPTQTRVKGERDYGPKSQRKATREDAYDILYGCHANKKAKEIADETGLSRGQVYSILGGYTFRDVTEDEFATEEA